jgi:hypothetical protein
LDRGSVKKPLRFSQRFSEQLTRAAWCGHISSSKGSIGPPHTFD